MSAEIESPSDSSDSTPLQPAKRRCPVGRPLVAAVVVSLLIVVVLTLLIGSVQSSKNCGLEFRPTAAPLDYGNQPLPLVSCHRGVMNETQENTEDGIVAAIRRGIPIIDLNVMVTRYGDLVCNHDDNIRDYLDGHPDVWIKNLTRSEIRSLTMSATLEYTRGERPVVVHYPSTNRWTFLDEVFDTYIDRILFWLDVKSRAFRLEAPDNSAAELDAFLQSKRGRLSRVLVSSSNPAFVIALSRLARQHGYFDELTIGLDYGSDASYWNRVALESGLFEMQYGFNLMVVGSNIVTQAMIDARPATTKVVVFPNAPGQVPQLKNVFSGLVDFLYTEPA